MLFYIEYEKYERKKLTKKEFVFDAKCTFTAKVTSILLI